MKIVVYTAIIGAMYDDLKDPEEFPECRYVCFTDQPYESSVWNFLPPHRRFRNSTRTARFHKIEANRVLPEADWWIWHDGCMRLKRSPLEIVAEMEASNAVFGVFPHFRRTCLYQEAKGLAFLKKDRRDIIERQMADYRAAGHPENSGLYETGLLIRKNTPAVRAFHDLWWSHIERYSQRDQLSLPFLVREANFPVLSLQPGTVYQNGYASYHWHRKQFK